MLIVVRLGCQIAIPFVNADMVAEVTSPFKEGGFSFLSAITGGSLENMSIFALNITPYITASIIMQLLTIAIPKLDELQKDGEEGRKKIAENYSLFNSCFKTLLKSTDNDYRIR